MILDRSFYSRKDREDVRKLVEDNGGRHVLVYLRAKSKDTLWERIVNRRAKGDINADSAYDVTRDVLDRYWNGFEAPAAAGEEEDVVVIEID